ncbi:MAG: hypothetical protein AB7E80_14675 [Hyphomicrobiaceae bacterium]
MASNLSSIGFVFETDTAFEETMTRLANDAVARLAAPGGEYAIWRSRTGAELWFHLAVADDAAASGGSARQIVGLTPFFEGTSRVPFGPADAETRPDDNAFEGILKAWVAPDAESGVGVYPLALDAVDFAASRERASESDWTGRVVAFCREARVLDANEEPTALAEGHGLARQAMIPIGLLTEGQDDPATLAASFEDAADDGGAFATPLPTVLMTGIIRSARRLDNEVTGAPFYWLTVDTLEATLDVVADPELLNREPVEGATLETTAWLFARVLD